MSPTKPAVRRKPAAVTAPKADPTEKLFGIIDNAYSGYYSPSVTWYATLSAAREALKKKVSTSTSRKCFLIRKLAFASSKPAPNVVTVRNFGKDCDEE